MSSVCRVLATFVMAAMVFAVTVGARAALRVCADPNNLPFSNQDGDGFENKIATLVARELGRPLEYFWLPQRRGFIRNSLNAGRCDVVIGVPAEYGLLQPTTSYYRSSYAFVSRRDQIGRAHVCTPVTATTRML